MYTYTSPSWTLPSSHPSRLSQSTELSSVCYMGAPHWLSILYMVVYTCQSQSPFYYSVPLNYVPLFLTPWTIAYQAPLSSTNSQSLLTFKSLNQWCHPTISSSVVPFSPRLPSFPASGSFPMSHLFPSGGRNIGASASATVLPMNIQGWFPLGLIGLISLQPKGLESSPAPQLKSICSSALSLLYGQTLATIHDDCKNNSFD